MLSLSQFVLTIAGLVGCKPANLANCQMTLATDYADAGSREQSSRHPSILCLCCPEAEKFLINLPTL